MATILVFFRRKKAAQCSLTSLDLKALRMNGQCNEDKIKTGTISSSSLCRWTSSWKNKSRNTNITLRSCWMSQRSNNANLISFKILLLIQSGWKVQSFLAGEELRGRKTWGHQLAANSGKCIRLTLEAAATKMTQVRTAISAGQGADLDASAVFRKTKFFRS